MDSTCHQMNAFNSDGWNQTGGAGDGANSTHIVKVIGLAMPPMLSISHPDVGDSRWVILCGSLVMLIQQLGVMKGFEMRWTPLADGGYGTEAVYQVAIGSADILLATLPPGMSCAHEMMPASWPVAFEDTFRFLSAPYVDSMVTTGRSRWKNWDFLSKIFGPGLWAAILLMVMVLGPGLLWVVGGGYRLWLFVRIYIGQGLETKAQERIEIKRNTSQFVRLIIAWAIAMAMAIEILYGSTVYDMLALEGKWSLIDTWDQLAKIAQSERGECLKFLAAEYGPIDVYYRSLDEIGQGARGARGVLKPRVQFADYTEALVPESRVKAIQAIQDGCAVVNNIPCVAAYHGNEYLQATGIRPLLHLSAEENTPLPLSLVYSPSIDSQVRQAIDQGLARIFELGLYRHWMNQAIGDVSLDDFAVKATEYEQGQPLVISALCTVYLTLVLEFVAPTIFLIGEGLFSIVRPASPLDVRSFIRVRHSIQTIAFIAGLTIPLGNTLSMLTSKKPINRWRQELIESND